MKKKIVLIALIPFNLIAIFLAVEQLTHSQKDAWKALGIVFGIAIVTGVALSRVQKLNKRN